MYKEVTIGDKTIPMLSMASVDLYYKNVFGEDPIKLQTQEMDPGDMVNFTIRMGFIMAEFAKRKERKEMMKLNEEAFYDWMDQFAREDLCDIDKRLTLADLDFLTYGQIMDILIEHSNDDCEYAEIATQADFDAF